ncbi:MAG: type II toxin-antitoxin system RelE/ParE family toxin [Anaerolineales bacterium]|nr:type II toxin-antitoxin system RelE/ParE family toxin [Anaerolineales bacterium]
MRIKFTDSGREQFLAAVAYIYRQNPTAARKFKQTAQENLKRLETFPNSGRVIPEFPQLPHREVVVAPYRFFYRVVGETIWVVAVWRDSQRPSEPPLSE